MTQVLIVDDEPSVRLLLRDVLEMEGYDVREAADGRLALDLLADYRPDCVLLDVMMPGMSGIEVLATMRGDRALVDLPVLMLTAASDDTTTWSGWATGANYYLAKPFDMTELLKWVGVLSTDLVSTDHTAYDLDLALSPEPPWQLSDEHAELFRSALGGDPPVEPGIGPVAASQPSAAVVAVPATVTASQDWLPDLGEPLAEEFRRALRTDQVWVAYQPIVAIEDRSVVGVEAFARWRHPQRGDLAPSEFLPLAERSGLGDELGRVILTAASNQVGAWNSQRQEAGLPPLLLTVNVSGAQLGRGRFLAELPELLRSAALAESQLILEVNEATLAGLDPETLASVQVSSAGGWRFSLDDSGGVDATGNLLRRFPVAYVKVDRSFVRGIGLNAADDTAVSELVAVAHRLGRSAVAEGVETRQQADWLQRIGCRFGQGFYFAHPAPAAHLTELVLTGAREDTDPLAVGVLDDSGPDLKALEENERLDRLDRALPGVSTAVRSDGTGGWSRATP